MNSDLSDLKRSYSSHLDRLGYFCDVCRKETRNANGVVYFESPEATQPLRVCHECLPEGYE